MPTLVDISSPSLSASGNSRSGRYGTVRADPRSSAPSHRPAGLDGNVPVVAALIVGESEQAFVREQLRGVATARFCETVDALERLIEGETVRAVLADIVDVAGQQVLPTLKGVHAAAPTLPLVLCFRPATALLRAVPDLVKSIPGLGIVLRGYEHIGLAVTRVLAEPAPASAAETLLRRLVPAAPEAIQPFITVCSLKGSPRLRVTAAATWSRIPRRTLERWLTDSALPGPATIVSSCAALHAAWWLDVHAWPTKRVVEEMQFSHPSALTRTFQRHFGCSVLQLRDHGGFNVMVLRLEQLLRRAQS